MSTSRFPGRQTEQLKRVASVRSVSVKSITKKRIKTKSEIDEKAANEAPPQLPAWQTS